MFVHILTTQHGSRMFVGTQKLAANSYLQGKLSLSRSDILILIHVYIYSLDGQVKLFDLRGADIAASTWDLHPKSLSAFDVHPISGVFAAYVVLAFFFTRSINSTYPAVLRQLIMYLGDLNASLFGPWYILNQCSLPVIFRLGSLLLHFAVYLRPLYQDILLWFSILRKCCML